MKTHQRAWFILAAIALAVAVLRYFMWQLAHALGLPTLVGSLLASITIVNLVALILIFMWEGRSSEGRYVRGAVWYVVFAAWCQVLIIGGILLTGQTGANTYYELREGPGAERVLLDPFAHAAAHAKAFIPLAIIGLLLGALVYWAARHGRKGAGMRPSTV